MPGFNFFKIYPNQVASLSQLLNLKGIPLVDSKRVVDGLDTFDYSLYFSHTPRPKTIKWIKELQKVFNIPSHDIESFSAVVVITAPNIAYAISFGSAHFYVTRYSDFEFGINIASRILSSFKIKNSREFSGIRTKSIETYQEANDLAYEAGEAVNFIKGVPNDKDLWGKTVSCGQSVFLRKRTFSVVNIHKICQQLERTLQLPVIRSIPTSIPVKDEKKNKQLFAKLVADMQNGNYMVGISQQQLSGVAFLFSDQYEFELNTAVVTLPLDDKTSLADIDSIVTQYFGSDYSAFLKCDVTASEDGVAVFTKPFLEFIDYIDIQENYYLEEGKWYQFDKNYLENIRREVNRIPAAPSTEIIRFDESQYQIWLATQPDDQKYYRERYLNDVVMPRFGYQNHDRQFDLFENATVEIADLTKGDTVYVVKLGNIHTLGYAIDQASAALKVLERKSFLLPIQGQPRPIKEICLWLFFDRQTQITRLSDVNSLIFLMKLASWRKAMLLSDVKAEIRISYK